MTQKKETLLLGAHLSIANGIENTLLEAQQLGCTAVQFFTKSNQQWYAKKITEQQAASIYATAQQTGLSKSMIAHASYLLNLASPEQTTAQRSVAGLIEEIERCSQLGIGILVLHPGAYIKGERRDGIQRIAENIDQALSSTSNVIIALENMAGQGTTLGTTIEELAFIRTLSHHKERIGFCLDTCHAFAAGYQFSASRKEYEAFISELATTLTLEAIKVIHLNDSKKERGARVDRHEHIAKGHIGEQTFSYILNDSRLAHCIKIIETPKEHHDDDKKNLAVLKKLIQNA